MTGGGGGRGPPPPSSLTTGGEFLLQLLQNPHQPQSQNPINSTPPPSHPAYLPHHHLDPAVAAMGPTLPFQSNGHDHSPPPPWMNPTNNFPGFPTPNNTPWGLAGSPPLSNSHLAGNYPPIFADEFQRLGLLGGNGRFGHQQPSPQQQQQQVQRQKREQSMMMFGSLPSDFRNQESVLNGNLLDQRSREVNRMNVEAQFTVQNAREVVGSSGSSKSSKIWRNSSRNGEFDRDLNSHGRNQWSNSPQGGGGGRGEGERGRQQQQQQQQHVQSQTFPVVEPRSAPPGFPRKPNGSDQWGSTSARRDLEGNVDKEDNSQGRLNHQPCHPYHKDEVVRSNSPNLRGIQGNASSRLQLISQLDHPGPPVGSKLRSVPASDIEESLANLHGQVVEEDDGCNLGRNESRSRQGDLSEQLMDSVRLRNGWEKNIARPNINSHDKDFRSETSRELQPPGHRMRNHRRVVDCRSDIDRMNAPFLSIYESLVPAEEEKAKQKQLLTSLEKLVNKEWPKAQLYLYGSCANSFGVCNSDIDVCLAIEDEDINKSELLLKLADILQEDNLENVQALTRARVPIVKLMDPVTGISCDICINNVLAVVNTKLLRDYAQIDSRLRQLAFIVKHWAKSRGVNVTYQGTLSSYAYVLMCIHFLQQRKPAILPCLQGMEATYVVSVEDTECAFFDQVQNLRDFGARNKESIAQLVWAFFDYWAYRHDYANAVISVRTGSIISKRAKDWTRRIGNDRHLICIEDPFQVSHDLGRVVDKYSIKILREEFERAANILQYDPDPCVTLFEPYVPIKA